MSLLATPAGKLGQGRGGSIQSLVLLYHGIIIKKNSYLFLCLDNEMDVLDINKYIHLRTTSDKLQTVPLKKIKLLLCLIGNIILEELAI